MTTTAPPAAPLPPPNNNNNRFINIRRGDPRPKNYTDPVGHVTHVGDFSTRTAPNTWRTLDARLIRDVSLSTRDVENFQRSTISQTACNELVKGIMMTAPHLIGVCSELKLAEGILQLCPDVSKKEVLHLMSRVPLLRILRAASIIVNHDGDVERMHNAEWWAWQMRRDGDTLPPGPGRVNRFLLTSWTRSAAMALRATERANDSRQKMTPHLQHAVPVLKITRGPSTLLRGRSAPLRLVDIQIVNQAI